jgi:hypothetical protein
MAYIHFSFDTKKQKGAGATKPALRLYPLVCMHVGSPQCDMRFLKAQIARIENDPSGRWVYMGDGGECVTKLSRGDVYGQLLSPQQQMECLLDLLRPIASKGLFGIRGNHGNRIYKESGLSFDHNLCSQLGLPYLGVAAMANIVVNRSSYDLYFHHGIDSGTPVTSKVKRAEDFMRFINADAVFTAHSHVAMELPPAVLLQADNNARRVFTRLRHQYICGSAYDSRTGYAEDRGYPPLLPSYISVEFDGRIIEGRAVKGQKFERYQSDGQHELRHDYILPYLENQPDNG